MKFHSTTIPLLVLYLAVTVVMAVAYDRPHQSSANNIDVPHTRQYLYVGGAYQDLIVV